MNRNHRSAGRFEAVSAEELMLVEGGGIISKLKAAAKWVKDHVVVGVGKVVSVGIKGKF
jgi:hypothetical protein